VKATLAIPRFSENFDAERGKLRNEELQAKLLEALSRLKV